MIARTTGSCSFVRSSVRSVDRDRDEAGSDCSQWHAWIGLRQKRKDPKCAAEVSALQHSRMLFLPSLFFSPSPSVLDKFRGTFGLAVAETRHRVIGRNCIDHALCLNFQVATLSGQLSWERLVDYHEKEMLR